MASFIISSDFGVQENKVCHHFRFFPYYLPWSGGPDAMILVFWMLNFRPAFSLSPLTCINGLFLFALCHKGFPDSSVGKESACNEGDLGSIPGLGRSPGEGKGYPLQYSGLENSMNCIVHGVTKSRTRLSDFHFTSLLTWWPLLEDSTCETWDWIFPGP